MKTATKKKSTERTGMRNGAMFCYNCGESQAIQYPIRVEMASAMMIAFSKMHKHCAPTWKEPEADQSLTVQQKAMWWISNGETGMSSKTMWNCLMGNKNFEINVPWDPDDFSRCYKLLQAVPEWKSELHKLKSLSPVWERLIDNWDKLTWMYEENKRTEWKNYKQIGMYDFMQTLTTPTPKI